MKDFFSKDLSGKGADCWNIASGHKGIGEWSSATEIFMHFLKMEMSMVL